MTTMELKAEYLRLSDLVGQDDDKLRQAVQALKRIVASVKPAALSEDEKLARKREQLAVVRQQKLDKLLRSGFNTRHQDLSVSPHTHEIVANLPHLPADFDYKETITAMVAEGTL